MTGDVYAAIFPELRTLNLPHICVSPVNVARRLLYKIYAFMILPLQLLDAYCCNSWRWITTITAFPLMQRYSCLLRKCFYRVGSRRIISERDGRAVPATGAPLQQRH